MARVVARDARTRTEPGTAEWPASVFRDLTATPDVPTLHRGIVQAAVTLTGAREAQLWRSGRQGLPFLVARWPEDGAAGDGGLEAETPAAEAPPEPVECPLVAAGEVYGQLVVFGPVRRDWLACLAAVAAACLGHLEARQAMRRTILQLVTSFSKLVESRDQYTEAHSLHIAELALQVGLRLGLTPEQLDQLTYAALLHDLGKIGIPDAILHKAEPLSEGEWATLRQHPSIGRRALEGIEMLREAAEIVEQHHERYDGKGYPKGLAGEAIRIEARIIAAVDA